MESMTSKNIKQNIGAISKGSESLIEKFKAEADQFIPMIQGAVDELNTKYEHIKDIIEDQYSTTRSFVKRHPISTLVGVSLLGFVVYSLLKSDSE